MSLRRRQPSPERGNINKPRVQTLGYDASNVFIMTKPALRGGLCRGREGEGEARLRAFVAYGNAGAVDLLAHLHTGASGGTDAVAGASLVGISLHGGGGGGGAYGFAAVATFEAASAEEGGGSHEGY